ncbi:hypothetical protein E2C01_010192 [Portunus trituberculatus]|uniref:Uncharacterized protein n=1 Tax=Portunus trituberculatus TaxID=210409 RepID=A0A5B7D7V5_PORTR|nr:hypothetical protein [Portunus trituberculatus]
MGLCDVVRCCAGDWDGGDVLDCVVMCCAKLHGNAMPVVDVHFLSQLWTEMFHWSTGVQASSTTAQSSHSQDEHSVWQCRVLQAVGEARQHQAWGGIAMPHASHTPARHSPHRMSTRAEQQHSKEHMRVEAEQHQECVKLLCCCCCCTEAQGTLKHNTHLLGSGVAWVQDRR